MRIRRYARIHRLGLRNLCADDYLMYLALAWYTILVACLNAVTNGGGSNLFYPDQLPTFSQHEIEERIKGSKIVVVQEQAMLNVIYTVKACLLFMYYRLTMGLKQQKAVKTLAIYVVLCWIGTQFAFFFACRPFHGYWAVPPPNPQCTTFEHYAIAQACFNLSSDTLMLMIPLPLLFGARLPMKQKLILSIVFGLGIFVIIAAVLTKVFNLSDLYSTTFMFWYFREATVAVYVSNLPMIWPLLREWLPFLKSFTPGHFAYYTRRSRKTTALDVEASALPMATLTDQFDGKDKDPLDGKEACSSDGNSNDRDRDLDKPGVTVKARARMHTLEIDGLATHPAANPVPTTHTTPATPDNDGVFRSGKAFGRDSDPSDPFSSADDGKRARRILGPKAVSSPRPPSKLKRTGRARRK